ncbi:MAG: TIR domain-containing protein [Planctomycetota bacterium]
MRNEGPKRFVFDVFLSHNGKDKAAVRALAAKLREHEIKVWLDDDQLIPGRPWQPLLEKGIRESAAGAVLVGGDGVGPWEDEEMQALLALAVSKKKPVIPVLLLGAPEKPELPGFLSNRTWVDLRAGFEKDGLDKLIWGITGEKRHLRRKEGERASAPAADVLASPSHPKARANRKIHVVAIGAVALLVTIVMISVAVFLRAVEPEPTQDPAPKAEARRQVPRSVIDQRTLTSSSTSGGSVSSPGEGSFEYDSGAGVSIQATPSSNYYFVNWTGTGVSAGKVTNPFAANTMVTLDGNYTLQANFAWPDGVAPTIHNLSPAPDSIQVPARWLIVLHVADAGIGVAASSVQIELDGATIYAGDVSVYNSKTGNCRRTGTPADFTYAYQSNHPFDFDKSVTVAVNAMDIAGVPMARQSYSFRTEMRSFGQNKHVSSGLDSADNGRPATACDSDGNIWVVWHAGPAGSRDIYLAKLAAGGHAFGASVPLTTNRADQANPSIALGNEDQLYVVWQDDRRGDWDIYGSSSGNGANWSAERRIADVDDKQNYSQTNPAVVVRAASPNQAYVVWQEDHAGNHDIYIAESTDLFVTNAVTQVTSDPSAQTDPSIAVSSSNTVYAVWTDARNRSTGSDIYGAAGSPWTNVPVVRKLANQSSPLICLETTGSVLHLMWVDHTSANNDIYYAHSNGLPAGPLTGTNIIDDYSRSGQICPAMTVSGTGGGAKVFACWQDERNVAGPTGDTDIYIVQTNSGSGTNVFLGDGRTNANQMEPAIGVDERGYPYVVWTDDRGSKHGIYYAGSTRMERLPLLVGDLYASSGGMIGTSDVEAITSLDDVSITVPPGACPYDVRVSITRVHTPRHHALRFLTGYEFYPVGLEFNSPVTITIPFDLSSSTVSPTVYWYDAETHALSYRGIENTKIIEVAAHLRALRFTTTHLRTYLVLY